jgi:hypothetical protein
MLDICGQVVEVGTMETDMYAPGITIKRADDSFVTIIGLEEDEVIAVAKALFLRTIVISFNEGK